jgi:outer membrane protein assembly factor BamB
MDVAASGALLDTSDAGELFIATQVSQGFEIRVLRVGAERSPRGILRVPGIGRAFAVDRSGSWAAAVTDQGTFRFSLQAADPSKTVVKVAGTARDVEFAKDSTLYVMEAQKLTALSADGTLSWSQPLVDGRRLAVGARAIVLDGTDKLVAFAPADGTQDLFAPLGLIQDLVVSRDGRWVGVIAEARRAVLFKLQ